MSAAPGSRGQGQEHPDDAVLLRLLDGQILPEDGGAAGHLAHCGGCQARLARLRARRGRLTTLLAETDAPIPALVAPVVPEVPGQTESARAVPVIEGTADANAWAQTPAYVTPAAIHAVPRARGGLFGARGPAGRPVRARRGRQIAAASVVLAGAALAAQPVRQWVGERWAALTEPAAERAGSAGGVPVAQSAFDTSGPGAPPPVVVAFTPDRAATAREPFALHFDERPAGGTLTVRVAAGARATAVARPEAGGRPGEFVLLPAGLRVRNAAAPRGTYELTLPAGTSRLRVTFGAPAGDTVLAVGGGAPVVVPLRGP